MTISCLSKAFPALYESVKCYTAPGDGVILFSPVYYPFRDAITLSGRSVVDIPLIDNNRHYEIDWDAFESAAKKPENKLLLFCSPHNPVGRVWTREELTRLAQICNENHVLVISDEIHDDLLMPGYEHIVYSHQAICLYRNPLGYCIGSFRGRHQHEE